MPLEPLTHDQLIAKNLQLREALEKTRALIVSQQEEIEKLQAPPNALGTYLRPHGDLAVISTGGRELRVAVSPGLIRPMAGDRVILNESMVIVEITDIEQHGDTATFGHELEDGRLFVFDSLDSGIVISRAAWLDAPLKSGMTLLIDAKAGLALGVVDGMDETDDLMLEEVPDITYDDIGGLDAQLAEIHDSIELPFLHADLFALYQRKTPKGILLYGPPGCGKTLVAKAVANSLAQKTGADKAYFLNVKGPQLLNKYVGETERKIREIFAAAREKASDGFPVIIFFDEMDSMFRQRGGGISSDIETTIVPQLLAEMDGVEELTNVIVIGASNRQELIDPAILRPGRLDVKIQVGRPDRDGAKAIFAKYLTNDLPYWSVTGTPDADPRWTSHLIEAVADHMYRADPTTEFLEVTYVNGVKEMLHFLDFASGAMIENIVDRAKTAAIKDEIAGKGRGITREHLLAAVSAEFKENEDLPNTTNPDDWARISGKKGERIAHVRPVLHEAEDKAVADTYIDRQYL